MTDSQGSGKVALVIGAGDATGGAIAARFAKEGYIACLTRRSADKLQSTVDAIRANGGQAFGYGSDGFSFEPLFFLLTAVPSLVAVWLRYRTGSLLLPVVLHNFGNTIPTLV